MKSARHAMILELIDRYNIETQDELASKLRTEGMRVTQATVSRDIKELRLIKVLAEDGSYKYATVDKAEAGLRDRFLSMFAHSVLSMTTAGNLIIVKTITGTANAAAEAIDSLKYDDVVGTIAGDNTIFVAIRNAEASNDLIKKFQALLRN